MFIQHLGATGVFNITDGDESYISCVEFTVYGFTGSMIPQTTQMTDGPVPSTITPQYFNAVYVNADTGTVYAAGTALTANGRYLIDTSGAKLALNVTNAGDNDFYVFGKPLAGTAAGASGSSSGTGPVSVIVQDPTQTYTQPTGDTVARAIHVMASGEVATGASGVAINPLIGGGIDASGNVQPVPFLTLDSAPTTATQLGIPVLAYNLMLTGTTAVHMSSVSSVGSDAVSGLNTLSTGNAVYNGTGWDRLRGSAAAGVVIKPYALPASDWTYAGATGGITNTTGVTMKTAAGAGVRNYVTAIQLENSSVTATEVVVNDGAAGTTLWRGYVPATSGVLLVTFPTPLKGTANTLTEVACVTTASATRVSAQGYAAA